MACCAVPSSVSSFLVLLVSASVAMLLRVLLACAALVLAIAGTAAQDVPQVRRTTTIQLSEQQRGECRGMETRQHAHSSLLCVLRAIAAPCCSHRRCVSLLLLRPLSPLLFASFAATSLAASLAASDIRAVQDLSLMEVGSLSTMSAEADAPIADVARLLAEANRSIRRLNKSRQQFNVISNTIKIRKQATLRANQGNMAPDTVKPQVPEHVDAQLVAPMAQPRIHDSMRFGTKYPIDQSKAGWVDAEVVGEDGKPYLARKQYGIENGEPQSSLSPFAKFIHPPAVGSAADVSNKDRNTLLTPLELKRVNSLQLRLKTVLDQLGANIVWDHTKVKNRRILNEFAELQAESRALMEEYEIRTGVKTIAWQLQSGADSQGFYAPDGKVTDIHFAQNPELAGRLLQRGFNSGPPPPTKEMLAQEKEEQDALSGARPKEQKVSVAWKKQANGVVKAKVNLDVVGSSIKLPGQAPTLAAKPTVPGTQYASGTVGSQSTPVQIDVVAPANEKLVRNRDVAAPPSEADQKQALVDAQKNAPKGAVVKMNF